MNIEVKRYVFHGEQTTEQGCSLLSKGCIFFSPCIARANLPFQTDKVLQLETISKRLSERESDDYAEARDLETQFHTGFISLGCNSRITKFYETNWSVGIVFLLFARSHMTLYRERESCAQHMEMLEFAKQGDVGGLRHIISEHLRIVNDTMDWLIDNGGNAIFKLM